MFGPPSTASRRGPAWVCLSLVWLCSLQGGPVYAAPLSDVVFNDTVFNNAVFNDIADSSFPEAVRVMARAGLVTGYPNGTFRPAGTVTRAELVATALRLVGDSAAEPNCFEDVKPSAWYAVAVCRAKERAFVDGVTETRFEPDMTVSAAQALKVLLRASGLATETPGLQPPASPWYAPYLQQAAALGLSLPAEPTAALTRDDLALLLFSLLRARAVAQGEALPSSGCGTVKPLPDTVTVGGVQRSFITSSSEVNDESTPQRLVFGFHGRTSPSAQVRRYYGIEPAPDTVFVYPSGLPEGGGFSWANAEGAPDYALFDALLELFARDTCVDLARVFVVGHSLGASFANSLGCARGDRVRGVGTLGGGITAGGCRGKVAAIVFHNPADRLVPFSEGERVRDEFLAQNGLSGPAVATEPAAFNCVRYGDATEHFPVSWCPHTFDYAYDGTYYPHTWPRGTDKVIMDFFNGL